MSNRSDSDSNPRTPSKKKSENDLVLEMIQSVKLGRRIEDNNDEDDENAPSDKDNGNSESSGQEVRICRSHSLIAPDLCTDDACFILTKY
jgi:hypothetical protein